jgi:hypothetical protein
LESWKCSCGIRCADHMLTQYRLVQSGKTASGGCSAGQGSSEPVAPRIYYFIIFITFPVVFSFTWQHLYRTLSRTNNDFRYFSRDYLDVGGRRRALCIPPGPRESILKVNSLCGCILIPFPWSSSYPPEHTISIRFFQSNLAWWPRDTAYQPHSSRFMRSTKIDMCDGTVSVACKVTGACRSACQRVDLVTAMK